jgi:hypothetical protein
MTTATTRCQQEQGHKESATHHSNNGCVGVGCVVLPIANANQDDIVSPTNATQQNILHFEAMQMQMGLNDVFIRDWSSLMTGLVVVTRGGTGVNHVHGYFYAFANFSHRPFRRRPAKANVKSV